MADAEHIDSVSVQFTDRNEEIMSAYQAVPVITAGQGDKAGYVFLDLPSIRIVLPPNVVLEIVGGVVDGWAEG